MNLLQKILVAVVSVTSFSVVRAELRLDIGDVECRGRGGAGYAVFSAEEEVQTIRFRVRSTEATPFFVTFGGASDGNGKRKATSHNESLEFTICESLSRRTALKDLGIAGGNEVIRGTFSERETEKELTCALIVSPGQVRGPGRYAESLRVNLYKGTPGKHVLSDSKSILVSIPVAPVTELSVGSALETRATGHKLDLGRLSKGKGATVDVSVRSNSGYAISVESENGGCLKNLDPSDNRTLPYQLHIGNQRLDLRAAGGKLKRSRSANASGEIHALRFTIDDLSGVTAGTYRDNVIISVKSEE